MKPIKSISMAISLLSITTINSFAQEAAPAPATTTTTTPVPAATTATPVASTTPAAPATVEAPKAEVAQPAAIAVEVAPQKEAVAEEPAPAKPVVPAPATVAKKVEPAPAGESVFESAPTTNEKYEATPFGESYKTKYEERPSLGIIFQVPITTNEEFEYSEQYDFKDSSTVTNYDNSWFHASPKFGVSGHIPFIWNPYANISGSVTAQQIGYGFVTQDWTIPEANTKRYIYSWNINVEAGPELGIPIIADLKEDKMLKVFGFGHVILVKNFLFQEDANGKSDSDNQPRWDNSTPYWGWSAGLGVRYAKGRMSVSAGAKYSKMVWNPDYDEGFGEQELQVFDVSWDEIVSPYITIEWGMY